MPKTEEGEEGRTGVDKQKRSFSSEKKVFLVPHPRPLNDVRRARVEEGEGEGTPSSLIY